MKKRNTFRMIGLVLAVLMMAGLFTACSKKIDSPTVGTWKAVSYESMGITLAPEDVGESQLEFKDNGKVEAEFMGEKGSGKWVDIDGGVKIDEGDDALELTYEGDQLVLDIEGVKMFFEKQ